MGPHRLIGRQLTCSRWAPYRLIRRQLTRSDGPHRLIRRRQAPDRLTTASEPTTD
jgi:hypothetical protein